MVNIQTEIEIDAAPSRVWGILTDFPTYPSWNPFITSIEGRLVEGERITVQIAPPGQGQMTFKPVLLVVKAERELRWRGTLGAGYLFSGEHAFAIESLPGGRARFTQSETFTGLLAPLLMSGARLQATTEGFEAMNEALKRRAEMRAAPGEGFGRDIN